MFDRSASGYATAIPEEAARREEQAKHYYNCGHEHAHKVRDYVEKLIRKPFRSGTREIPLACTAPVTHPLRLQVGEPDYVRGFEEGLNSFLKQHGKIAKRHQLRGNRQFEVVIYPRWNNALWRQFKMWLGVLRDPFAC